MQPRSNHFCLFITAALLAITTSWTLGDDIVINELMFHPSDGGGTEDPLEEYIELLNTSTSNTVDLTGWRFTKGIDFTIPSGTLLPGEFLVVCADLASFQAKYPAVTNVVGGWTGKLSNSGELIRLRDALDLQVDELEYSDQGDWAQRVRVTLGGEAGWAWQSLADGGQHSLELMNPLMSNRRGQNWTPSVVVDGTPGSMNTVATTNIAPVIRNVKHSPAVPNFAQAVTIEADLSDEMISNVTAQVRWRVSAASPGAFNSTPMSDPDGDGEYTATIPPQAEEAIIEFYVEAGDGLATRTWPAPSDQGQVANALYQVDSTVIPDSPATYRAVLTVNDKAQFDTINRNSDALLNVTFIVSEGNGDSIRYQAGMRIRGNGSRNFTPPPLRVNLPRDTPWNGDTRLNINSRYPWLQFIGMQLFTASDLPAPDGKRVNFRINGEDNARSDDTMRGFFIHLEPLSGEFIDTKYPEDNAGNFYKKRSASGNRDDKRWGVHFETDVVYTNANWYLTDNWSKLTNDGENDWSDLQQFVETMHQATEPTYYDQVNAVVDIEQWVRWFAIMSILNNRETSLGNGIDDDYSMYRGINDSRFKLVPHDLDTIFGEGDTGSNPTSSAFPAIVANIPRASEDGRFRQLEPFFNHPTIRRMYFDTMRALLEDEFSKTQFDARIENHLGDWITDADANTIVNYMDTRRSYLLGVLSGSLSVTSALPVVGTHPQATNNTATLGGNFHPTDTWSITVNGQPATLDLINAQWDASGITLLPGINRILVETFDAQTNALTSETIEIWYDDGTEQALTSDIAVNTTLTAANGPYRIATNLTVAAGATLTIEAGTTIYFDEDVLLTVNGILRALGSKYARIHLSPAPDAPFVPDPEGNGGLPDGPPKWDGVHLIDSPSDQNLITYTDIAHAQDNEGSFGIIRSEAVLDNITVSDSHIRMVYADSSSVILQNSVFPNMFAPGESPDALGLDNISEHVKGVGTYPINGHFIIRNNLFGTNAGHNDVIDVDSGRWPNPILQVLDNVFLGAGDEQLDLGGDVYVAGNHFMNIFKDDETSDRGYANAISTGDGGTDTLIVVTRNVFWDVDHAINLKRDTSTIFENNTVVKIHPDFNDRFGNPNIGAAINLYVDEPGALPGDGAFAANNIFQDVPRVFGNVDLPAGTETPLQLENNLMSLGLANTEVTTRLGTNLDLDPQTLIGNPHFIDELAGNFDLLPGSPARGRGTAGQDLGAGIAPGLHITGEPAPITTVNNVTLTIGGPGIFSYQARLNGGAWSAETTIGNGFGDTNGIERTEAIDLIGLPPGTYTLEVRGRDFAGNMQAVPTASRTWTIDPSYRKLVINEVLADNESAYDFAGTFPDYIELYNAGTNTITLDGMALSDDPAVTNKFVFGPGSSINGGEYLVLYADSEILNPGIHLGFALDAKGEQVTLYDTVANGQTRIDAIAFGLQVPDRSIGRLPLDELSWGLNVPTPGASNIAQPYGDPHALVINEWLATPEVRFTDDFIELYNPDTLPVPIGGLFFSDEPLTDPTRHRFPDLSFLPAQSFTAFTAENVNTRTDATQLNFALSGFFEWVALFNAETNLIDEVHFQCEVPDISQGRFPDGADLFSDFELPTPGLSNNIGVDIIETNTLVELTSTWSYEQTDTDLGTNWVELGYNDTAWPQGPGLLYQESGTLNGPAGTLLDLNPPTTHYFRHHFNFTGDLSDADIAFDLFADDGAVVYLNGVEIRRVRMPGGVVTHTTFANAGQSNATREGPFAVPPGIIRAGQNVMAVSVHQDDGTSGDVVFGLEMRSTELINVGGDDFSRAEALLDSLRITELMYYPAGTNLLEFIELQNISDFAINLEGVRLNDAVDFVFQDIDLSPGEYIIVCENLAAFTNEYGSAMNIAGTYTKKLSNGGEEVEVLLPAPYDAAILRFTYDNLWYPTTAGGGFSLEILNPEARIDTWNSKEAWRPSGVLGGTPAQVAPPIITSPLIASTTLNDPFAYQITASQNPDTFGAAGLPAGLSIDVNSGLISGNALEYGTFQIAISANNSGGGAQAHLDLNIDASGPHVGYTWAPVSSPQPLNGPIPVTLTAVDAQGRTVIDHTSNLSLSGRTVGGSSSTVLITECGDRNPDYIEIQNVGDATADTDGWVVALNNADDGGVNVVTTTFWQLPTTMASGEVMYRTDSQTDNYFGSNIVWNHRVFSFNGQHGWAMIVDDVGNLVDFVAWGYDAAELATIDLDVNGFTITLTDEWLGDGIDWDSASNRSLLRSGNSDNNDQSDWSWIAPSRGNQNEPLTVPFPGSSQTISVQPDTVALANGSWQGEIAIGQLSTNVFLVADDSSNPTALSNPFAVEVPPPPGISSSASLTAVEGQLFYHQVVASNFPTNYLASSPPPTLVMDGESGLLSGTPQTAGTYNFDLVAQNSGGNGTQPVTLEVLADSDGDGMPDTWEQTNGLSTSLDDANGDADNDGQTNLAEFRSETNPLDPGSVLKSSAIAISPTSVQIDWQSVPGRRYRIFYGTDLINWTLVPDSTLEATSVESTFIHQDTLDAIRNYYRVETADYFP